MNEVKHQLQNIVDELGAVVKSMSDNKEVGKELYIIANGEDLLLFTDKDDVIEFLRDDYGVSNYDDWFDDLANGEIADICQQNPELSFNDAMAYAYDKYVEDEIEGLINTVTSDSSSIHRANESRVIKLRVV